MITILCGPNPLSIQFIFTVSECSNSVDDISDEENETSTTPSDTSKGFATPDQVSSNNTSVF